MIGGKHTGYEGWPFLLVKVSKPTFPKVCWPFHQTPLSLHSSPLCVWPGAVVTRYLCTNPVESAHASGFFATLQPTVQ